jgi:ribose transport system permease protein
MPPEVETPAPEASSSQLLRRLIGTPDRDEPRRHSLLERYGGLGLLALMIVIFTITLPGKFLTYDNLIGVVSNQTIGGIMALALLLPLASGVFDISIGGAMTLAVVLVTWLFQTTDGGMPIPLAILIALAAGALIGVVNGTLVIKARVDPFIATIGVSSVLLGLSEVIANGTTISTGIPSAFTDLGRTFVAKVPLTLAYVAVVAIALWYLLEQTPFGRRVYATGAARDAARLAGVKTDRIIFLSFVASALLASLAGVVYGARIGAGPPNVGANYLLPAFAAAFLGATTIRPGRFNPWGTTVALYLLVTGTTGFQLLGSESWVEQVFDGGALVIAVTFARLVSQEREA